jgi:hypothetical protein
LFKWRTTAEKPNYKQAQKRRAKIKKNNTVETIRTTDNTNFNKFSSKTAISHIITKVLQSET